MTSTKAFNLFINLDPRENYFIYYKGNLVEEPLSCNLLFSSLEESLDFLNKNMCVMQGHRMSEFVFYNICLFFRARRYSEMAEVHMDNAVKLDIRIKEVALIDFEEIDYVC